MARVYLNLPVMTISGSLKKSDKYCFVTRNGKTFTRAKGERVAPLTEKEKASHSRFRRAVDWANLVQRNDDLVAHYRNMWKESSMKCPNFRGWLIQYYYRHFPSHNS